MRRDREVIEAYLGADGGGAGVSAEPLLAVEGLDVRYGAIHALQGRRLEVARRRDRDADRRERRGQDDAAARDLGPGARRAPGTIRFEGARRHRRAAPEVLVALGISHVPEGRAHLREPHGAREPRAGRLPPRRRRERREDLERVLALFPRLRERLAQARGTLSGGEQQMLAIGRALMARAEAAAARRAVARARAAARAADLRDRPRDQRAGHDGGAGRAERAPGAARRAPRLRARDRRARPRGPAPTLAPATRACARPTSARARRKQPALPSCRAR